MILRSVAFGDGDYLYLSLLMRKFFFLMQSMDEKVQKALACPCLSGLRSGPCGNQFSEAFSCFLRSTAEEKVHILHVVNEIKMFNMS